MPIVRVTMMEGRTLEDKRALARLLTDAMVEALGVRAESVQVHLEELQADNVAIGGHLQADNATLNIARG